MKSSLSRPIQEEGECINSYFCMLYHLNDAQYNIDILVDKIEENLR